MEKFEEWFEQFRPLKGRFETMKKALEIFKEISGGIIVETGTTRMKDDWGAGMSTMVFGAYCKEFGHGKLWTVDISEKNISISKEVTKDYEEYITYIEADSHLFLKIFPPTIHLLYLDSVDCPIEVNCDADRKELEFAQKHQLKEIQIALPKVSADGVVLLDDNAFEHGGKTALTKAYLKEQGWTEIMSGQQSLWRNV